MARSFDACSKINKCSMVGKCVNTEDMRRDCSYHKKVIRHDFPALYKLKQLGFVDPLSNTLTNDGYRRINESESVDDLVLILMTIAIVSEGKQYRVYPKELKQTLINFRQRLRGQSG